MCIRVSATLHLPVHNIDTDLDYATIQEAIDSPETLDGHTILVDDRTYYEHVTINKPVRVFGANQSTTIIDGDSTGEVVSLTVSGAEISGFTIQNGRWAIDLHNVQNASVTQNKVLNCSYRGIFLYGCSRSRIANNTIMSTNQAGIELWKSQRIVITNNTVANTSHGIYLLNNSTKNTVSNNFVTNNPQGIALSINCNNNTIAGNTVTSSRVGGIVMGGAHNNTIYHNNILNNPKPFFSYEGSSNFWDDGTEGNFWEDYPGPDLNEDGIGDTPYTIDENNRDNHPLMGIFYDFNVAWEEENYYVNVISNSTVSDFDFRVIYEPEVRKRIDLNVTGEDNTVGFCRVMIPTTLMNYSYTVLVNGEEANTTVLAISNSTHTCLYLTFNISTHANSEPVASFTWAPYPATIQDIINFVDMSHDDEAIISWIWSFGDGTNSTEQNPPHQYVDKGIYEVQLTVTDNEYVADSETRTITIRNLPPVAEFTYSPTSPKKGQDVQFTDASSDPEGKELTFLWDFGDGGTSTHRTPVHKYTEARQWTVNLTVTDDEGVGNSIIKTISISELPIYEQKWFYTVIAIVIVVGVGISAVALRKKIAKSLTRKSDPSL